MKHSLRISLAAQSRILASITDLAASGKLSFDYAAGTIIAIRSYILDETFRPDKNMKYDREVYREFCIEVDRAAMRSARARARRQPTISVGTHSCTYESSGTSEATASPSVAEENAIPVGMHPGASESVPSISSRKTVRQATPNPTPSPIRRSRHGLKMVKVKKFISHSATLRPQP